MENSSSKSVLGLQGYVVDTISTVSGHFRVRNDIINIMARWKDIMAESPQCPYEQGYDGALWRLMLCDLVDIEEPAIYGSDIGGRRAEEADEFVSRKSWDVSSLSELDDIVNFPVSTGKQFFMTDSGRIGIGDTDIMVGDIVSVLLRGKIPFILREAEEKKDGSTFYQLVWQAYIHGIMDGRSRERAATSNGSIWYRYSLMCSS